MYQIVVLTLFAGVVLGIASVNSASAQTRSYQDTYINNHRFTFDFEQCVEGIADVYSDSQKKRICQARQKRHNLIDGECPISRYSRDHATWFCVITDSSNTRFLNLGRRRTVLTTLGSRNQTLDNRQAGSYIRLRASNVGFLGVYYREHHNGEWPGNPECSLGRYNQCVADDGTIYRITGLGVDVIRRRRSGACNATHTCASRYAGTGWTYMSYPWFGRSPDW